MQVGACYSDLVVGVDISLRTYSLISDPALQAGQQVWMKSFQDYAVAAQYRSEALRYGSAPVRQLPEVSCAYAGVQRRCFSRACCVQRLQPVLLGCAQPGRLVEQLHEQLALC